VKIVLDNVHKSYGKRTIVNRVNLSVMQGEIVGLLGPNGAGKTTTFYMATGLETPDKGKVWLNELDITALPMNKRALLGIGYLAQEPSIFRQLSVSDNILLVIAVSEIQKIIAQLRDRNLGVLITDHNVRETLAITDRAYIMRDGQILASGSAEELYDNPLVRQYYLGDDFQR
jgi:ABC-type lipopolysaccharide export system ATPase subunit